MSIAFHHVKMLRGWACDLKRSAKEVTGALSALGIADLDRGDQEQFKSFLDSLDDKIRELVHKRLGDAR